MAKNSELGRTMIEVLATLSILGMITGIILVAIQAMFDKVKLSQITQQLTETQKAINTRFAAEGSYKNMNVADLADKENILPSSMLSGNGALHHSYRSPVTITPADAGGVNGANKAFEITFTKLPFHVCTELLLIGWEKNNESDLISIKVNQTEFTWASERAVQTGGEHDLPMDIVRAGQVCNTNNQNNITWKFF